MQHRNSRVRGHNPPEYTKEWLSDWMLNHPLFNYLYNQWVESEYQTEMRPSVDRLKDNIGYTKDNIQLTTWDENKKKRTTDIKKGIATGKCQRPVVQISKDGVEITSFRSLKEAERATGVNVSNIHNVCSGRYGFKTAGGFKWKFKM
jgi:hypothetical protein